MRFDAACMARQTSTIAISRNSFCGPWVGTGATRSVSHSTLLSAHPHIVLGFHLLFILGRLFSDAVFLHAIYKRLAADVEIPGGMSLIAVKFIQRPED